MLCAYLLHIKYVQRKALAQTQKDARIQWLNAKLSRPGSVAASGWLTGDSGAGHAPKSGTWWSWVFMCRRPLCVASPAKALGVAPRRQALSNDYLKAEGLVSLRDGWIKLHHSRW